MPWYPFLWRGGVGGRGGEGRAGQRQRRRRRLGGALDADDLGDSVEVVEREDNVPDDVVEARAEAAAGDDGGAHCARVEPQRLARSAANIGAGLGRLPVVADNVGEDAVGRAWRACARVTRSRSPPRL